MANFITKISVNESKAFELQIAKMIYATNSSFNIVENKEFIKIQMLQPGYNPPSRTAVGNHLLDEVHKDVSYIYH